jgi:hypothetical protein
LLSSFFDGKDLGTKTQSLPSMLAIWGVGLTVIIFFVPNLSYGVVAIWGLDELDPPTQHGKVVSPLEKHCALSLSSKFVSCMVIFSFYITTRGFVCASSQVDLGFERGLTWSISFPKNSENIVLMSTNA